MAILNSISLTVFRVAANPKIQFIHLNCPTKARSFHIIMQDLRSGVFCLFFSLFKFLQEHHVSCLWPHQLFLACFLDITVTSISASLMEHLRSEVSWFRAIISKKLNAKTIHLHICLYCSEDFVHWDQILKHMELNGCFNFS